MIKKLKVIWKNKAHIWAGFMNWLFPTTLTEKAYKERIEICKACPLIDNLGNHCFVAGTEPCCSACGCSLTLKLRDLTEQCPHPEGPKWKEVTP